MRGKKAGEKYLSVWWFFVLAVIAGGIVISVSIFSVADISVKGIEADILVTRFIDCAVENGYLKENFLGSFDVFKECGLNREIIDSDKYYLEYGVYDFDDEKKNIIPEKIYGVADFKEQCKIKEKLIQAKHYAECSEKKFYALGKDDKRYILYVIAGSNQQGGRK